MGAFTFDGTENRMRWDKTSTGFMEVWYLTANHKASGLGLWVRYTITSPKTDVGAPYCELWGFTFDPTGKKSFAAKERFPIDRLGSANGRDDGALVRIGDAWLAENHAEGRVSSDGTALSWSLDWTPAPGCFQHLPAALRSRIEKRVSTVCSPNLAIGLTGSVRLGRKTWEFDQDPGCQSHRWGSKNSLSWTWAHCSSFDEDKDAIFEGVAAKAAIGPLPAPTVTFVFLRYEGRDLVFNELKWAIRAKSRYELPTWAFAAFNDEWKIAGAARTRVPKTVQVTYSDPDGGKRYCANSEIADLALEIYRRESTGWRHYGSLSSTGSAHLEFGRKDPFTELPVAF